MNLVCKNQLSYIRGSNEENFDIDWILDDIRKLLSIFLDVIKVLWFLVTSFLTRSMLKELG